MEKFKVAVPEWENPVIKQAFLEFERAEMVPAAKLEAACQLVREGKADTMVAGIDYTTREVILACRDCIGVEKKVFSSCFVMRRGEEKLIVADAGVTKHPDTEQFYEIIRQTYETAKLVLDEEPRVALLSFSTFGSGGKDPSIELISEVKSALESDFPEMKIEGEMQLDAAVNREIGRKKWQGAKTGTDKRIGENAGDAETEPKVAGQANVLICPDLNSGNILYKAMEQFGGFEAAGPILQGFKAPISDLSRGSSIKDVKFVLETLEKLVQTKPVKTD